MGCQWFTSTERVRGRQRRCPGAVMKGIKDRNAVYILDWRLSPAMSLSFVYMKAYMKHIVYVHCWQSPFSALFIYSALLKHNLIIDKVVTYEVKNLQSTTYPPTLSSHCFFFFYQQPPFECTQPFVFCSEFECTAANERCTDKSPQDMWCSQTSIFYPNMYHEKRWISILG